MMHVVICDDEPCFQEAVVNAVKKMDVYVRAFRYPLHRIFFV